MAEVQQDSGHEGKKGKSKQKKISTRVDFTPMVDMNMLLLTFFMFCTTLSKPQTMEIAMPPKEIDKEITEPPLIDKDLMFTFILDAGDHIYYYQGNPNYEDPNSLVETSYSSDGIRQFLLGINVNIVKEIDVLKKDLLDKSKNMTQEEYKEKASKIKKETKRTPVVLIKPTGGASFKNLIDVLDEMQITNIARYSIVDTTEAEGFLLKNKFTGGKLTEAAKAEGKM